MTWNLVKICLKSIKLKSENLSLIAFLEKKVSQKNWEGGGHINPPPPVQIGLKNPPFCSFASFLIVLLTPFINKPDFSRDLTVFIIFIPSFKINHVVMPDTNIFIWIVVPVAAAADVNTSGIKVLLVNNGLSAFSIKGNQVFSDSRILCN